MKKIVDDMRLIYKCCSLYYEDEKSQHEISESLGISRPSVSRMLKLGRELRIVSITVNNPDNVTYGKLERTLEKKFGLKEAIVVEDNKIETGTERINSRIGEETLAFLSRTLEDDEYVGVSMGMMLQNIVRAKYEIEEPIHCTFVPIVGGVGESRMDIHSNYLAGEFAKRFGGECVQFFAPAVFSDVEVLRGLMKEKTMRSILGIYRKVTTLIMGIGIPDRVASTLLKTGYVDAKNMETFVQAGAVGDISLQFFDQNGDTEQFRAFNERVAGMPIVQLKKVPRRIGIAAGKEKKAAVLGAIRGGFLNILITDADCAKALL